MLKIDNLSNDIDMTAVSGGAIVQNGQNSFGSVCAYSNGGVVSAVGVDYSAMGANMNGLSYDEQKTALNIGTGNWAFA
jgi:hypothetical protein